MGECIFATETVHTQGHVFDGSTGCLPMDQITAIKKKLLKWNK